MNLRTNPRPSGELEGREPRPVLSEETGPSTTQHAPRPCTTLYSNGHLIHTDKSRGGDRGRRVLKLEAAMMARIVALVDELPDREPQIEHRHDARTISRAAYRTSGHRVLLEVNGWRHPQSGELLQILEACRLLAGKA